MKRYFPIALGGLTFLLASCSSSTTTPPGPTPTPTSTTTSGTSTGSSTSDASKTDKGDDASKTDKSDDSSKSEKTDASDDKSDSTEKADASSEDSDSSSARNLYVEQLHKPDSKLNTGVVYWLELNRDGKRSHVTNKTQFQEGDQLRIHIKPNITCYSYILMLQGSKGDRSVLFPSEDLPDNKLKAGREVVLPKGGEDAWLKFDEHPGTEILRVVVSRKKIDPEKELPGEESSTVAIASARGDDDNIPDGTAATIVSDGEAKATRNLTVVTKSKHPDEEGQTTVIGKSGEKALRVDIAMDHREAKTE